MIGYTPFTGVYVIVTIEYVSLIWFIECCEFVKLRLKVKLLSSVISAIMMMGVKTLQSIWIELFKNVITGGIISWNK